MNVKRFLPGLLACGLLLLLQGVLFAQSGFEIERVSVGSDSTQGNSDSVYPAISGDGRYIAFYSFADNLVSPDTNSNQDIFVHDRLLGETRRVSVASGGREVVSGISMYPSISGDGRYIAFLSDSSNLVRDDTNGYGDIFVHDRETGVTRRVSVASNGAQANRGAEYPPVISDNGQSVAFLSYSSNLVSGDTNICDVIVIVGQCSDIFVHDLETGVTTRVSVASDGTQANGRSYYSAISADGRYVAFESVASNLVSGDFNTHQDIFVHDRDTGITTRVSVNSSGAQGNGKSAQPSISGDGRYVAFESVSNNLVSGDTNNAQDIFVHDRDTGVTTRITQAVGGGEAGGGSYLPKISSDGRFVTFESDAANLVSGDTNNSRDIFVYDRETAQTVRVNIAFNGAQANSLNGTRQAVISAGGHFIAFESYASNLVPHDTNNMRDIFVVESPFLDADPFYGTFHRSNFATKTPTLTWNRLTSATHYEIQIARRPDFSALIVYEAETTGPELEHQVIQALNNGIYYWRVRGVGAEGEGQWSAPDTFAVDAD